MIDEPEHLWPRRNDIAFGCGQRPNFHSPEIAIVGRFLGNPSLTIHADAFREAADMIVQGIEEGRYPFPSDRFFFPVAYLYRHAIELSLKNAIRCAIALELLTEDERLAEILSRHNLHQLWNQLKTANQEFWPETESDSNAERIIAQFHAFDNSGQAFRYPTTRDGTPSFSATESSLEAVDLAQLKRVASGLCMFLDACASGFDDARRNMPTDGW